jgi:hypothetical protein
MVTVWHCQCSSQVAISASKSGHWVDAGITGNCSAFCSGGEGCEIDHLISPEVGGSDDPESLNSATARRGMPTSRTIWKILCTGWSAGVP